jgi:His-Xaa-Ser system protein HxsD
MVDSPAREEEHGHVHYSSSVIDGVAPAAKLPSLWQDGQNAVVAIDPDIIPLDAAVSAAYKFSDVCYVWIERHPAAGPQHYCVFLRPKHPPIDLAVLVGEFTNELVDQRLRQRLEVQAGPLRTIIAAQAFAEGNLLNPADQTDYRGDHQNVAARR